MIDRLVHRLLLALPPQAAHALALLVLELSGRSAAALRWLSARYAANVPGLATSCWGIAFANPLGVAAGFDKDARAVPALAALGFGFVEIGTVTPRAQPGNAGPRLARLAGHRALVNRLGFPSAGAAVVARRLARSRPAVPVGINLGVNASTPLDRAPDDYADALQTLYGWGDYFVVNVSSPNTPGLRGLQEPERLGPLLEAICRLIAAQAASRGEPPRPLLVKVSPDMTGEGIDATVDVVLRHGLAGVVVANTTASSPLVAQAGLGGGGLSGAPLLPGTVALVRAYYRRLAGRAQIIGVGGISTAEDAYAVITAGASLVQAYTGFVYAGPQSAGQVCSGLAALLERDGWAAVHEAVGSRA